MATLELVKARKGWRIRWYSKSKADFETTRQVFKGHLFDNYTALLAQM